MKKYWWIVGVVVLTFLSSVYISYAAQRIIYVDYCDVKLLNITDVYKFQIKECYGFSHIETKVSCNIENTTEKFVYNDYLIEIEKTRLMYSGFVRPVENLSINNNYRIGIGHLDDKLKDIGLINDTERNLSNLANLACSNSKVLEEMMTSGTPGTFGGIVYIIIIFFVLIVLFFYFRKKK